MQSVLWNEALVAVAQFRERDQNQQLAPRANDVSIKPLHASGKADGPWSPGPAQLTVRCVSEGTASGEDG